MAARTVDIHARIPVELAQVLDNVSKLTERTKSNLIYRAVESYLKEAIEDYEDIQDVLERESRPNRKFYTSEEMEAFIDAHCSQ